MAAGLREEVAPLHLPDPRHSLRLAWRIGHALPNPFSEEPAVPFRPRRVVRAEDLFVALDGRSVTAGRERLQIEVFSVRDEAGSRWVQLALVGESSKRFLTVRLAPADTAQHAVMILAGWLADPKSTADIFNVA